MTASATMRRLEAVFGIDLRALAALRVALAGLTLVDLALRAGDLSAMYTDAGVLPRDVALAQAAPGTLSIYFLAGSPVAVGVGFAIHALAAVAMLVGFWTRAATVVVWALMVSLDSRNPLLLQGADDLMRALLFWSMLLPLGARWSLDSRRTPGVPPKRMLSLATAGLLVQSIAVYAVTSSHKTGVEWHDGTAVWVVLAHDHFGRPWAQAAFLEHPGLLRVLCMGVLALERVAPFLLLSPVLVRPARYVALGALVALQVGFGAMLYVGHFPWVSVAALLPFVPTTIWDALERRLGASGDRLAEPGPASASPDGRAARLAAGGLAGVVLSYVVAWSVAGVVRGRDVVAPLGAASVVAVALGLDATWTMFAPFPARDSGWFVMPGRLVDGSTVDVFPALARFDVDAPVTYEKPPHVFESFPDGRWLDYLMILTEKNASALWSALAAWTCRGWNATHAGGRRLAGLEISFVLEEVTAPGAPRPRVLQIFFRDECRGN